VAERDGVSVAVAVALAEGVEVAVGVPSATGGVGLASGVVVTTRDSG
jgi:hypothetical protein